MISFLYLCVVSCVVCETSCWIICSASVPAASLSVTGRRICFFGTLFACVVVRYLEVLLWRCAAVLFLRAGFFFFFFFFCFLFGLLSC